MKKRHESDPDRPSRVTDLEFEWAVLPVAGQMENDLEK